MRATLASCWTGCRCRFFKEPMTRPELDVLPMDSSILVCSRRDLFELKITQEGLRELHSWRALTDAGLLPSAVPYFSHLSECKPQIGTGNILITSSAGGAAVVEWETGRCSSWMLAEEAHSICVSPIGLHVVAAGSYEVRYGDGHGELLAFSQGAPAELVWRDSFPGAHGVIWRGTDELWALGRHELRRYEARGDHWLHLVHNYPLPEPKGHDLSCASPGELTLTTPKAIWRFNIDAATFEPDKELCDRPLTKSVDYSVCSHRTLCVQALDERRWWAEEIELLAPAKRYTVHGRGIYKARWTNWPSRC